jgi:hypothetical protein
MTLCSDGHDEVCYEGRACPCCTLRETIADLERQIGQKDAEIDRLNEEE